MSSRTCCIPGCTVSRNGGVLHKFPNPEFESDRFQIWISNIGSSVAELDKNYIFSTRRVCRKHFEQVYYYRKNRLCQLAVPTLFMPAQANGLIHKFIRASKGTPALCDIKSCNQSDSQHKTPKDNVASVESTPLNTNTTIIEIEKVSQPFYFESPASHNQGEINRTEEKQLKNTIIKLRAKLNRSNKINMLLKQRLQRVKKNDRNIPLKELLQEQITQGEKKHTGRQFYFDEKVSALSLCNANQNTFRLPSNRFILPYRRTLELLQKNTYKLVKDG